jgi:hypothetical protein
MGTVPIPGFSPLTLTRSDEPTLELPLPISRVDAESSNTGGHADEGYSPRKQAPPHRDPNTTETQPATTASDPTHQVNLFA